MKIGNPDGKNPAATVNGTRARSAETVADAPKPAETAPAAPSTKAAATGTQVQLSDAAAAMIGGSGHGADIDSEKVQRVAQSIADGTYKVNAEAIADKLIGNAKELLGKVSS